MQNKKTIGYVGTILLAAILWFMTFVLKPMNFWLEMSLSVSLLVFLALLLKPRLFHLGAPTKRHFVVGILSAMVLYLIFYFGNIVSGFLFPFKDQQISLIYGNKAQASEILIGILLIFIIGPGEELFWRGFSQNFLAEKLGEWKGYIIAALLYGAVHATTGNFMIVMAALVCGFFWGFIYKQEKNLWPVIISHALWDITIFILLPVT